MQLSKNFQMKKKNVKKHEFSCKYGTKLKQTKCHVKHKVSINRYSHTKAVNLIFDENKCIKRGYQS